MAVSEVNLKGCAKGKVYNNNTCDNCPPGTYTNIYGSNTCNLCGFGHSTLSEESKNCFKCDKGYYANVTFVNNSNTKAEMYSASCEVAESSK